MIPIETFLRQGRFDYPVILFWGEEPLLIDQALARVRAYWQNQGIDERRLFFDEGQLDWQEILYEYQNLGLFTQRQLIDVRVNKANLAPKAQQVLKDILNRPDKPHPLVLWVSQMTYQHSRNAWVKLIEAQGVVVEAKALPLYKYSQWIAQQAQVYQLQLNQEQIQVLSHMTEGNLLAADQALQRLSLLPESFLKDNRWLSAVADQAEYALFALSESLLLGDLPKAQRRFERLWQKGTSPNLILWLINRDVQELFALKLADSPQAFFRQRRMAKLRQKHLGQAAQRFTVADLRDIQFQLLRLESILKGRGQGQVPSLFYEIMHRFTNTQEA